MKILKIVIISFLIYSFAYGTTKETSHGDYEITNNLVVGETVGVGTTGTLDSIHEVDGAEGLAVLTVTGNTTLDNTHSTIIGDTNGSAITITLPTATSAFNSTDGIGRIYNITAHYDNTQNVIVEGNGVENINGASDVTLSAEEILTVQPTNTEWFIVY